MRFASSGLFSSFSGRTLRIGTLEKESSGRCLALEKQDVMNRKGKGLD